MANFNFNQVILGGRLTAEPELKHTVAGIPVTSFNVAVNRRIAGKDGTRQADFITCVAWRTTAEFICKYFRKGGSICVVGNIQTRTWEDDKGNKRYNTEVIVEEVNFVDSASEKGNRPPEHTDGDVPYNPYTSQSEVPADENIPPVPPNDDDLPF